jgi:hypothetical protein
LADVQVEHGAFQERRADVDGEEFHGEGTPDGLRRAAGRPPVL